MWFLKDDPEPAEGKVYRLVIHSHTCNLGQLVGVFESDNPVETILAYYRRAGVRIVEPPTLVEDKKPDDKGIDVWLRPDKSGKMGFAIMNRLKLRWLDWMLLGKK